MEGRHVLSKERIHLSKAPACPNTLSLNMMSENHHKDVTEAPVIHTRNAQSNGRAHAEPGIPRDCSLFQSSDENLYAEALIRNAGQPYACALSSWQLQSRRDSGRLS